MANLTLANAFQWSENEKYLINLLEKYIKQSEYISSRIKYLKTLYPDKEEYKNVGATYKKVRTDLEKAISKLVDMMLENYKEKGRNITTGSTPVYDAKLPHLSDVVKSFMTVIDDNTIPDSDFSGGYSELFKQIEDSAINDYIHERDNPPAVPPEAPEVPPLKIEPKK